MRRFDRSCDDPGLGVAPPQGVIKCDEAVEEGRGSRHLRYITAPISVCAMRRSMSGKKSPTTRRSCKPV